MILTGRIIRGELEHDSEDWRGPGLPFETTLNLNAYQICSRHILWTEGHVYFKSSDVLPII